MSKLVFCICGSFCNHKKALTVLEELVNGGYDITAVISENAGKCDTRFGSADEFVARVEELTGREAIRDIPSAEANITGKGFEGAIICPCTGNTLSKLRHGITDTAVTMAVKCLLRNDKPILVALATNDALGATFENLAVLRNRKCYSIVPLKPDDPEKKPNSMICDFTKIKAIADEMWKK